MRYPRCVCTDQCTVRTQSEPRPPHTWSHPAGCIPSTVWLFWSVLVGEFLCRSGSQLRLASNLHIFLDPSDNREHCNPSTSLSQKSSYSYICPLSMCILPSKVLLYLLNFSWSHSLLSTLAMSLFQKTGISLLASWKINILYSFFPVTIKGLHVFQFKETSSVHRMAPTLTFFPAAFHCCISPPLATDPSHWLSNMYQSLLYYRLK